MMVVISRSTRCHALRSAHLTNRGYFCSTKSIVEAKSSTSLTTRRTRTMPPTTTTTTLRIGAHLRSVKVESQPPLTAENCTLSVWSIANGKRICYHPSMDEGRKRVLGIMAAILASLHMQTADDLFGGPQGSPRSDKLIAASVQWAEAIMRKIDKVFSG